MGERVSVVAARASPSDENDSYYSQAMRIWTWPVVLGLLTASGLVSALVADGWGDAWSWIALGVPLAVLAFFALRRLPSAAPRATLSERARP